MSRTTPFLGETSDRNKAFPGIDAFELTVAQDRWGHYSREDWQRTSRYSKGDVPRNLRCLNPHCQQGGLDLQQIITFWPSGEHTFRCNGHEGTPKGRHRGDPCENSFAVTLSKSESK